jgi:hypothetical protein
MHCHMLLVATHVNISFSFSGSEKSISQVWKGLGPRLIYGGLLIALQFVIYDYCRVLFHVSPGELNVFLDVFAGIASKS